MRKFLFVIFILSIAQIIPAQSVVITPKKVTYTRPKPKIDDKKTFTVIYPKVKASTGILSKRIETEISFDKNLAFDLKEEMGEYQWLEEAGYYIGYNKNGILSVYLWLTGTAAHQSTVGRNIVVDLKTGRKILPANVFTNLRGLIAKIKRIQKEEIKQGIEDIKKDPDSGGVDTDQLFQTVDFKELNLEGFSVDANGITFKYDYGFPYIILALQPDGRYFLNWKEIKPFIKPRGLLGRFIR